MDKKMDEYKDVKIKEDSLLYKNDFFPLKNQKSKKIDFDSFEENLNISDIKDEFQKLHQEKTSEKPIKDTSLMINSEPSIDKDFSVDLDNINEDEFNERKISICSLQSEEFNYSNNNIQKNKNNKKENLLNKKITKKITKEDLNNIPLPVFSCIYCSNEEISFKHLSLEIITNKYLFQSSIYDIIELNKIIVNKPIIDKDDKNEKLINLIIKNTEYINKFYKKNNIYNFFSSNDYLNYCNKELFNSKRNILHKIEDTIIKKKKDFYFRGINKISKNSLNNKCLFNSTNSLINNCNALSGFVEPILSNNNINFGKNFINNYSNISINFNSISSNNNENGNCVCKDNNNLLVSIVEKIEKNIESANEIDDKEEIMDFFKFDTERKIKKDDIIWENDYYNIWNPNINDEDIIKDEYNNNYKYTSNIKKNDNEEYNKSYKLKVNLLKSNYNLKSKISNSSFLYQLNNRLSMSQMKDMCSTNNSSLIKSNIYNITKDYFSNINNSQASVKKENTIKNLKEISNYSIPNNSILKLKLNKTINKYKNNYIKINYRYDADNSNINKIILRNNSINKNNSQSYNSHINYFESKIFSSNINYTKNDIKLTSLNKLQKKEMNNNKIKENQKHKIKLVARKLNNSSLNSYFNINNYTISSKTTNTVRNPVTPISNSISRETEITSSKIKYKQNNKLLYSGNSKNICLKLNKFTPKKINLYSFYTNNRTLKRSVNFDNRENSEFSKLNNINNNKNKNMNSSVIISNKNSKQNKNKIKFNLGPGIINRRNIEKRKIDLKKINFSSRTKICNNKNSLIFPYSLVNNSTSRIIINNSNMYFNK